MDDRIIFGATGLNVSRICFGTWQLSPRFWGEQSRTDVLAAMNVAYDGGINFFDTADAYGDGLAETIVGEFLAGKRRDSVVICTKVFNHFNPDGSRYPDLSPAHIRKRCDLQLQRMGIETIDLYLLHMFDPATALPDVAQTLDDLKKEGKIRSYGVSNHRRAVPRPSAIRGLRCNPALLQPRRHENRARPAALLPGREYRRDGLFAHAQGTAHG